jgi:hypothetical protein
LNSFMLSSLSSTISTVLAIGCSMEGEFGRRAG